MKNSVKVNINTYSIRDANEQLSALNNEISSCEHQLRWPDNSKGDRGEKWKESIESAIAIKKGQRFDLTKRLLWLQFTPARYRFLEEFHDMVKKEIIDSEDYKDFCKEISEKDPEIKDFLRSKEK